MAHLTNLVPIASWAAESLAGAGIRVNARGCRQMVAGLDILAKHKRRGGLPRVVILAMGSNASVSVAEKEGKTVDLLVVPGVDPFDAMVQTAAKLEASRLVTGVSQRMDSDELARRIGLAWERLPEPRHPFSLEIITPGRPSVYVNLGPHPPRLWPEDLDRTHNLWLRLQDKFGSRLHHRDVVGVALRRLEKDLEAGEEQVVKDLERELGRL